jgi:diguanylate cyclase (GGDEF)-like protein
VLNLADISAQRRELEELSRDALADPVTQMGTRMALQEELAAPSPATVITTDVDNFKGFNDQFGHQAGNFALAAIARRWQNALRWLASTSRFGGDEFVAVLRLPRMLVLSPRELRLPRDRRSVSTRSACTVSMWIVVAEGGADLRS